METRICVECKTRKVGIKKHELCTTCYQRLRRKGVFLGDGHRRRCKSTIANWENKGEIEFIRNYFKHNNWVHHPGTFRLDGHKEKYTPDFYDGERNVFIEVSGTRQAYHANKHKYKRFMELYPELNFEIRLPTGEIRPSPELK